MERVASASLSNLRHRCEFWAARKASPQVRDIPGWQRQFTLRPSRGWLLPGTPYAGGHPNRE